MPAGWAWCRFGNFIDVRDGTHYSPKYVEKGYPFVTSKNLVNGKIDFTDVKYISEKDHNDYIQRSYVEDGDILFAMIGSIGNPVLVKKDREFSIKNVALFKPYSKQLTNMNYLFYFLLWIQENLRSKAKGGMQPFIPLSFFRTEVLIPIPPAEEQFRIVSNIEENLSKIDFIEENKRDLENIIKQAKSKILDLAIHGKLVPQDPNDEPAEELLKRIATSDNRPYKKFDDEVLFDIPETWAWCTGNDLFNPMTSKKPEGETFKYIDIDAIDNKKHCVIKTKTLAVSEAPSRASRKLNNGDVLFSLVRPYLENIALIEEKNSDCIASTGFYVCKPRSFVFSKFLFYLMTSEYVIKGLNQFMKGDNSPSISGDDIKNWRYPLPPLTEQYRIVTKIEELFSSLDIISSNIE